MRTKTLWAVVATAIGTASLIWCLFNLGSLAEVADGHEGLAAWVQAVGSIAAIAGAWLLTRQQIAAQRRQQSVEFEAQKQQRDAEVRALRETVVPLMLSAHRHLVAARKGMKVAPPTRSHEMAAVARSYEGALAILSAFPAHLLGDRDAVAMFFDVLGAVRTAHVYAATLGDERAADSLKAGLVGLDETLVDAANRLKYTIDIFCERFGFVAPLVGAIE